MWLRDAANNSKSKSSVQNAITWPEGHSSDLQIQVISNLREVCVLWVTKGPVVTRGLPICEQQSQSPLKCKRHRTWYSYPEAQMRGTWTQSLQLGVKHACPVPHLSCWPKTKGVYFWSIWILSTSPAQVDSAALVAKSLLSVTSAAETPPQKMYPEGLETFLAPHPWMWADISFRRKYDLFFPAALSLPSCPPHSLQIKLLFVDAGSN